MEVAVIGLGNFGLALTEQLFELGHDLSVVDANPAAVGKVQGIAQQAVVADATNRGVLEELGVGMAGAAVVSIGDKIGASVLITLHLKEMAVPQIIAKAISAEHEKVLLAVGADKVIFPERDAAHRLAGTLDHPDLMEYLPIGGEYHVVEMDTPPSMIGKTLMGIDLRKNYNVNVIALREKGSQRTRVVIRPDYALTSSDRMVVLGAAKDLERLRKEA